MGREYTSRSGPFGPRVIRSSNVPSKWRLHDALRDGGPRDRRSVGRAVCGDRVQRAFADRNANRAIPRPRGCQTASLTLAHSSTFGATSRGVPPSNGDEDRHRVGRSAMNANHDPSGEVRARHRLGSVVMTLRAVRRSSRHDAAGEAVAGVSAVIRNPIDVDLPRPVDDPPVRPIGLTELDDGRHAAYGASAQM